MAISGGAPNRAGIPMVPMPRGKLPVSADTTLTLSIGTARMSAERAACSMKSNIPSTVFGAHGSISGPAARPAVSSSATALPLRTSSTRGVDGHGQKQPTAGPPSLESVHMPSPACVRCDRGHELRPSVLQSSSIHTYSRPSHTTQPPGASGWVI